MLETARITKKLFFCCSKSALELEFQRQEMRVRSCHAKKGTNEAESRERHSTWRNKNRKTVYSGP